MVDRAAKRAEGKGIGYDRWAAVHNLKQMAATVAAMEQYGFTPDELDAALVSANADLHSSTAKLKPIETAIREKKDLQIQSMTNGVFLFKASANAFSNSSWVLTRRAVAPIASESFT